MTPAELSERVEMEIEKERREWYRLAWFTSILLSPHLKRGKTIDPAKLLPEFLREARQTLTEEERLEELKEIKKSVGIEDEEAGDDD